MNISRSLALGVALTGALAFVALADPAVPQRSSSGTHVAVVAIGNFTFEPNALTVRVGTEVSWRNDDDVPHTVVGTDQGSPLKSPPLDTNDSYSIKLTTPGRYTYFCSLHPHMTGTIVVE